MYLTQCVISNGRTYPWNRQPIGGKIHRRQRMSNLFKPSSCLHCPGLSPPIPFSLHPGMEPSPKHRNLYLSHLSSTTVGTVPTGTDSPGHNTVDAVHTEHSTVVATTVAVTTSSPAPTTPTTRASVTTALPRKLVLFCLITF